MPAPPSRPLFRLTPCQTLNAVGYVLGAAALWMGLPAEMSPAWRLPHGEVIWLGGPMAAFLLPTASTVTCRVLRGLCAEASTRASDAVAMSAICDAILLRLSAFIVGVHAAVLAVLLGLMSGQAWSARVVPIMLGLTMISVGNLLPRTRANLGIGIRTPRTLSCRACWMKTHRLAGYVTVAGGCAVLLGAVAAPAPVGPRMILAVGPIATIVICVLTIRVLRRAEA